MDKAQIKTQATQIAQIVVAALLAVYGGQALPGTATDGLRSQASASEDSRIREIVELQVAVTALHAGVQELRARLPVLPGGPAQEAPPVEPPDAGAHPDVVVVPEPEKVEPQKVEPKQEPDFKFAPPTKQITP